MKYLLSEIEFKAFVKGPNVGKEYAIATVSNADCDVDVKTTRVALMLPPAVIEAWKAKVKAGEQIIREGQFFTVNGLPSFYKHRYGSTDLITDANGTPIVYNSLQVFSFMAKQVDENGVEAMRPFTNVRDSAMRMISSLFRLATAGPAEHSTVQAPAPDESDATELAKNGQPYPPQIKTPEQRAQYDALFGGN